MASKPNPHSRFIPREEIEGAEADLVRLDIMMPGLSGYDVCRKIRADPGL